VVIKFTSEIAWLELWYLHVFSQHLKLGLYSDDPRNFLLTLQGFPPIATNPLGKTTISVAIGGYYCTETVILLQFVCLLQHKI
jgi:hypothetical protein